METKEIKLKKLRMTYFKGFRDFEVDFKERTIVKGRNATGKSTIFDACSWLLFGKDSLGNADFQIKTIQNGKVIEKVDHEVYGELEINGAKTTLKRVLHENYDKNDRLKGNETRCFFDGVPVSVTEYHDRVNDIVDEKLFKLITNVNYFHTLKMEERRNILISIAGTISNEDIAAKGDGLDEIVEMLNHSTVEDIKRKIAAEKKRIKSEQKDTEVRIDEQKKNMPEAVDFDAIKKQIDEKKKELTEIDKLISDRQEKVKAQIDAVNEKRKKIGELRMKQQDILIEAELEGTRVANEKNKDFYNYESILSEKKEKLSRAERKIIEKNRDIEDLTKKIEGLKQEREKLVEEWKSESAKQFNKQEGKLICPLYNHECKDEDALFKFAQGTTSAESEFYARKKKRLTEINEAGLKVKDRIEENANLLSTYESELVSLKSEYESLHEDYLAFDKLKPVKCEPEPVIKENIQEWVELENQIKPLYIEEVVQDNSDLIREKNKINDEIIELSVELDKKVQIENAFKRIAELEKEQRTLAQALSEQERIEDKLVQFNKIKMEEVDRRINGKFKYVTFKLFSKTLDDSDVEVCETLINGVPYYSANNAARINAGLDIINALCEYHGIFAPIFIDNAECVNDVIQTKSQQILLYVTDGLYLEIE